MEEFTTEQAVVVLRRSFQVESWKRLQSRLRPKLVSNALRKLNLSGNTTKKKVPRWVRTKSGESRRRGFRYQYRLTPKALRAVAKGKAAFSRSMVKATREEYLSNFLEQPGVAGLLKIRRTRESFEPLMAAYAKSNPISRPEARRDAGVQLSPEEFAGLQSRYETVVQSGEISPYARENIEIILRKLKSSVRQTPPAGAPEEVKEQNPSTNRPNPEREPKPPARKVTLEDTAKEMQKEADDVG